jgi:hypothetical protein
VSTSTTLLEPAVVRLRRDLPDDEVKAGETRTIVHADEGGAGHEVEFPRRTQADRAGVGGKRRTWNWRTDGTADELAAALLARLCAEWEAQPVNRRTRR